MKTLILSDVHGNLPAFSAVLEKERDATNFVFLGDIVNYGPWSNECVTKLFELQPLLAVLGNHDLAFLQGDFQPIQSLAGQFFAHTYPTFKHHESLKKLVEVGSFLDFCVQHTLENRYIYSDTPVSFNQNYMIGHSHYQYLRTEDQHILCNPGSVGQNRKNLAIAQYAIYQSETGNITLHSCPYDVEALLAQMRRSEYPQPCLDYYYSKLNHEL